MTVIIDGKEISKELAEKQKQTVENIKKQGVTPKLVVVSVGDDPASKVYIRQKKNRSKELGIDFEHVKLESDISQEYLHQKINELNNDKSVHGYLVQLPLPEHLSASSATSLIDPEKDVDGFHIEHSGCVMQGDYHLMPCTPRGVLYLLDYYDIDVVGKEVLVIGRSQIVGLPLAVSLINRRATVTVANSKTKDLKRLAKQADIIISAVGSLKLVTRDMVKEGAVIIDVGINRKEDGKLAGDVDFEEVRDLTSYITPVPGGVGPMTIAMLMHQTLLVCCKQEKIPKEDVFTYKA